MHLRHEEYSKELRVKLTLTSRETAERELDYFFET